jgi:hypothetical protein
MVTKDFKNLNHYIVEGFSRLLDLGATRSTDTDNPDSIEEDIYSMIAESWEEVGDNIREAMNQYDRER